ncbi:hypothetical protein K457DRAFT_902137 [Linnemannia elongata AG-77]|uniref:Uncharacterized protein n=1 Tax=Linnemannia elongata AG-77 TaxID=1314771 RepID=A0A197KBX1_9FUNG|nr:hypothetical protein K457DRAFT_902137 [Linnemannia elongata AG-77]
MSTSKGGTNTGTDASTTIPGSIFSDDIPSAPSSSDNTDYSPPPPSSLSNNNGGGGASTQIEVNSTTQIVLITLGIAVGVLFLLGVAAAYYISHKNKRACLEKEKGDAAAATTAGKGGDLEKSGGFVSAIRGGSGRSGGEKEEVDEEGEDLTTLTMPVVIGRDMNDKGSFSSGGFLLDHNEKGYAVNGNGYYSASEGESAGFGHSRGSTPGPPETLGNHNDNNNSSWTATTTTAGASALATRSRNPRNSFIDVAQVYAHRQSLIHPVDPAIAMQQRMSMIMVDNYGSGMYQESQGEYPVTHQQQQQQFLQYEPNGSLGATAGSSSHSGQWVPSTPTENNSLLLDPFKTNNNSMASLNQMPEQGPPQPPPAQTQPMAVPAMMMRTASPPLLAQQQAPLDISYQPPLKSSDPSRITSRRGSAVYHQGMIPDRRSVAGWPTDSTGGSGADGENSWHRKRASVVIPAGTIPVRLWKEDAAALATTGTPSDDMQPPRSPLTSGPIPRIGVVLEEGKFSGEGNIGYRPSVRNGAAVFEGSMPRKPTSRSPSRSRLDDSSIDALAVSEALTSHAGTTTQQATYRRKWATGQIAVDSNINTTQGNKDDAEHVVVSLPSPRGCLLENEYPRHQAIGSVDSYNQQQSGQDGYEFGMRSLPIVLTHKRGGSTATKSSSIGGGGGRRSTELMSAGSGTSGGTRLTYLDDYREQKQQKKLQQQQQQQEQQQQQQGGGGESSDSAIKGVRRRSAQFLQNALKRASLYQNNASES